MKIQKLLKATIFAATALCTAAVVAGQATTPTSVIQPTSFSLTIKAPDKSFKVGEDALVYIVFANVTNHDIYFTRAPGYNSPEFSYYFHISNEGGEDKESLYSKRIHDPAVLHSGSQTMDLLKPGESFQMKAHLNRIADLDKPGRYTVQVSRNDRSAGRVVNSNEIVVDIVNK